MKIKITDNFLPLQISDDICSLLLGKDFPRYYNPSVTSNTDESPTNEYFTHLFYGKNRVCSDFYAIIEPIVLLIKPRSLFRIKANMYPVSEKIKEHGLHTDTEWDDVKMAVYYVNDNNGYTALADGKKIESVKNRIVELAPLVSHTSSTSTTGVRVTVNFNWF